MWTLERLNVDNSTHAGCLYDLALACKDEFLNDYDTDIILLVEEYNQQIKSGATHAFLAQINNEFAGVIWVDVDRYEWGRLHGGMLPRKRGTIATIRILQWMLRYCFDDLKLRALEATVDKHNRRAERIVKAVGFTKMGLRPEAVLIDGRPHTHVMLHLTREKYKGKA